MWVPHPPAQRVPASLAEHDEIETAACLPRGSTTTMSDINPIARPQQTTLDSVGKTVRTTSDSSTTTRGSDRVELSEQARLLSKLKQLPEIREGLVNSVKSQIEAGNYDTAERFDTAVNALIEDLES